MNIQDLYRKAMEQLKPSSRLSITVPIAMIGAKQTVSVPVLIKSSRFTGLQVGVSALGVDERVVVSLYGKPDYTELQLQRRFTTKSLVDLAQRWNYRDLLGRGYLYLQVTNEGTTPIMNLSVSILGEAY